MQFPSAVQNIRAHWEEKSELFCAIDRLIKKKLIWKFAWTELPNWSQTKKQQSNKAGNMLKIQMLEQIVTNDNVADEKANDDAEQSTSRTPINQSPQRNGLVYLYINLLYLLLKTKNI